MDNVALTLCVVNFLFIGLTPRFFFRRDGKLNLRWWLTAAPVGLDPLLIIVLVATNTRPLVPSGATTVLDIVGVVLDAASVAMLFFTLGTHRVPLSLWHQDDDRPESIVTHGAYRRVRHPFYVSYLLAFTGAVAFYPHWVTIVLLGYVVCALNITAAGEERRLAVSGFGAEYQAYMARTGRFVPRLRNGRSPARDAAF